MIPIKITRKHSSLFFALCLGLFANLWVLKNLNFKLNNFAKKTNKRVYFLFG